MGLWSCIDPQPCPVPTPTMLSVRGHTQSLDHISNSSAYLLMAHPVLCLTPTPQLVMEDIFISGNPLLESVGLHEPLVEELRAIIANAVRKAMIPLQAYAKKYRKYLELNNNDITTFLKCVCACVHLCVSV